MIRLLLLSLVLAVPAFAADTPQVGVPDWAAPNAASAPTPASNNFGPGPPPPPPPPPPVPVDGGLTLLALAGVGYAGKKLRDRRRA